MTLNLYLHSCVTVRSPEHHDKYHKYKAYEHHQYVEMPPETEENVEMNTKNANKLVTLAYLIPEL